MRPRGLEELITILPRGIGVIPLYLDVRQPTIHAFGEALGAYEEKVTILAEQKVDVIHPQGAPPFMLQGVRGEERIIREWEEKYQVAVFTSGMNSIRALRALEVKRFVGATYNVGEINDVYTNYFTEAGFQVLAMEGLDVPWEKAGNLSSEEVYAHVKTVFLKHPGAEGIYMLGSAWSDLRVIEMLEQDLGVPVVHPIPARCWEIQKRLHVRQPVSGCGRLLGEMP
jgi:maleate cis-trans isomerase